MQHYLITIELTDRHGWDKLTRKRVLASSVSEAKRLALASAEVTNPGTNHRVSDADLSAVQ